MFGSDIGMETISVVDFGEVSLEDSSVGFVFWALFDEVVYGFFLVTMGTFRGCYYFLGDWVF